MALDKIEPRLLDELHRIESQGPGDQQVPVVIQVEGRDSMPSDYAKMEAEVDRRMQGVKGRLLELGVQGPIRLLVLSNAIEASLTPSQIRAIGDREDVKRIVLNRADRVIA
jgi:hypothetical protein